MSNSHCSPLKTSDNSLAHEIMHPAANSDVSQQWLTHIEEYWK